MHEKKAKELLDKHRIEPSDIRDGKATLHHLRGIVRAENLPFDVFRELVKLRR
jgi:hypothetical protein